MNSTLLNRKVGQPPEKLTAFGYEEYHTKPIKTHEMIRSCVLRSEGQVFFELLTPISTPTPTPTPTSIPSSRSSACRPILSATFPARH